MISADVQAMMARGMMNPTIIRNPWLAGSSQAGAQLLITIKKEE
jgi:hypothetical protein